MRLQIDQIFDFLGSPRNLNRSEFLDLACAFGLEFKTHRDPLWAHVYDNDDVDCKPTVEILSSIFKTSRGEIKKAIKANIISINGKKIDSNRILTKADFFTTESQFLLWPVMFATAGFGKKERELILFLDLESQI